jgi:hypothetical protein
MEHLVHHSMFPGLQWGVCCGQRQVMLANDNKNWVQHTSFLAKFVVVIHHMVFARGVHARWLQYIVHSVMGCLSQVKPLGMQLLATAL